MKVLAYCDLRYIEATRKAAGRGAVVLTSPPLRTETINPGVLENRDFLYFDFHGEEGSSFWTTTSGVIAMDTNTLKGVDLGGAVVFAANCYLANDNSPMMDALLDAGAGYVIGGKGKNYANRYSLFGAALLGAWVRRLMSMGMDPLKALGAAKRTVKLHIFTNLLRGSDYMQKTADALGFTAYYRKRSKADGTDGKETI